MGLMAAYALAGFLLAPLVIRHQAAISERANCRASS